MTAPGDIVGQAVVNVRTRDVPVFVGWDAHNTMSRLVYQRTGKSIAGCVVLDGLTAVVDYAGRTTNHRFTDLGSLAPSYQDPPRWATIDPSSLRVIAWTEPPRPVENGDTDE